MNPIFSEVFPYHHYHHHRHYKHRNHHHCHDKHDKHHHHNHRYDKHDNYNQDNRLHPNTSGSGGILLSNQSLVIQVETNIIFIIVHHLHHSLFEELVKGSMGQILPIRIRIRIEISISVMIFRVLVKRTMVRTLVALRTAKAGPRAMK